MEVRERRSFDRGRFFDGEVHLALLHSRKLTPLEIASHVHTSKISVNRRPYGLTLDQNPDFENQSAGTLLGVLNAMDDDYNPNLTYALLQWTGRPLRFSRKVR